jgi:hypothetical protein
MFVLIKRLLESNKIDRFINFKNIPFYMPKKMEEIKKIENVNDLISLINSLPYFSKGFEPEKHTWTNGHEIVNYTGHLINIKYPTFLGDILIRKIRHIGEKLWNDSYIVNQTLKEAFENEEKTYEYLLEKEFPTLSPLPDIICKKEINKIVNITLHDKNFVNLATILEQGDDKVNKGLIEELGFYYSWLNALVEYSRGEINYHGDAWAGNVLKGKDNKLYILDFEFKTNPKIDSQIIKAKGIQQLVVSSVYRSKLSKEEVVESFIRGYEGIDELKTAMKYIIDSYNKKRDNLIRRNLFDIPVFGMPLKDIIEIKQELYKQLD